MVGRKWSALNAIPAKIDEGVIKKNNKKERKTIPQISLVAVGVGYLLMLVCLSGWKEEYVEKKKGAEQLEEDYGGK